MKLDEIFGSTKLTENGDIAFSTTGNKLLDILFLTEYYQNHLDKVPKLESSDINRLFAMFIRDPRFGLGKRDLGRKLMSDTYCNFKEIVKAGRVDDLFHMDYSEAQEEFYLMLDYCKEQIEEGNELFKKWMPRFSSKDKALAELIANYWKMNKKEYSHFVKCNTTENKMSRHNYDEIAFEHVPSLAMIKYAKAFASKPETKERYAKYLEDVKSGKKDLKVATTSIYDIYRNRTKIDTDLFFSKIEKISGSWIPIVDTSGSMMNSSDSYGKALAIGHYLAKCSTYCPDKVVSFSSYPQLLKLGEENNIHRGVFIRGHKQDLSMYNSIYEKEIASMHTGDCSNTDFGKVMELLSHLDEDLPEYLVVLSDMEFDLGSSMSKDATMRLFKSKGYTTKIIWWNLNGRNATCPEMDESGNIFISGYNPLLLKYLKAGFDGNKFLQELLNQYRESIL